MGLNRSLRCRAWCGVVAALAVELRPRRIERRRAADAEAEGEAEGGPGPVGPRAGAGARRALGRAPIEAWDGAKYELKQIKAQEAHNKVLLRWARHGYRIAEQRAEARLVALFESDDPSAIDAIFGATNLNDMLDRIETIHATTALDRRLVEQVQTKRAVYREPRASTRQAARQRKAQTVLQLDQRRRADRARSSRSASGCSRRSRVRFSS